MWHRGAHAQRSLVSSCCQEENLALRRALTHEAGLQRGRALFAWLDGARYAHHARALAATPGALPVLAAERSLAQVLPTSAAARRFGHPLFRLLRAFMEECKDDAPLDVDKRVHPHLLEWSDMLTGYALDAVPEPPDPACDA